MLYGGLPVKRVCLVAGNSGTGKSVLGMEFLVNGINLYDEPGIFVSFEEKPAQIIENFSTIGWDLADLEKKKKIKIIHFDISRLGIQLSDDFDLGGIFARLDTAIKSVGAKRIVFDTMENLYTYLADYRLLRQEIERIFNWIKYDKGLTSIVTAEATGEALSRSGLEQFVSDCVINLSLVIRNRKAVRKLQVMKYRGSEHNPNLTPFNITQKGFYVFPLSSIKLNVSVSSKKVSTGIPELDEMLGGKGIYQGSTMLISGSAGTGKGTLSAHFTDNLCRKGRTVLYLSYEESLQQICRNMRSIGIDLQQWIDKGRLFVECHRASERSMETNLIGLTRLLDKIKPDACVIDPITAFDSLDNEQFTDHFVMLVVDMLKKRRITAYLTSLCHSGINNEERSGVEISSIADTWIQLRQHEVNYERILLMYIVKSRGTAHTNMVREFHISESGITFSDLYVTEDGILTGWRRIAHINREKERIDEIEHEIYEIRDKLNNQEQVVEAEKNEAKHNAELERKKLEKRIVQLKNEKELLLIRVPEDMLE